VVGTGDDTRNLALVAMARQVNPDIHIILRQNDDHSALLFQALRPDMLMVPSVMVARQCLAAMTSGMLPRLQAHLADMPPVTVRRLLEFLPHEDTRVWEVRLNHDEAPAVFHWFGHHREIRLGELLRDNRDREARLELHVVALQRGAEFLAGPDEDDLVLRPNDTLLMAGAPGTQYRLDLTLRDEQVLSYVLGGVNRPDGTIWRWIESKRRAGKPD